MARRRPQYARRGPSALRGIVLGLRPSRLVALLACAAGVAAAEPGLVAQVGSIVIDVDTFLERAKRVDALHWAAFGAAWPEQRRRFLDEVLIPEALLALAGERSPSTLPAARDRALARALDAELLEAAARVLPSDADVRAYRASHEREFGTPRALALWRILLPTEADARRTLAELTPPKPDVFSRLARERSIDSATNMRAGNLGLVAADGQTSVPELRVSAALFAAADRVEDGELVPEPVSEGNAFAVVWRRASRAASSEPAAEIAARIASRLAELRATDAQRALIERLRREHLSAYHPEPAADHEPRFPEVRTFAPRASPPASRVPRLLPEATDRGLR